MRDQTNPQSLPFRKMHGLGNDFVIVDARVHGDVITPEIARHVGDRHRGVGFDQLAVISDTPDADVAITFWNADGTTAGACGNATRCVASLVMAETGRTQATLLTERGALPAEDADGGLIRVNMGMPVLDWAEIPLAEEVDTLALPIEGAPGAVGMGNPHMVFAVPDAQAVDLERFGPEMEHHPLYPKRTNVEVCEILDRETVRMRVWERGVGITLACGSGACAAAVALARKGLTERAITLHLDGGPIHVDWREDGVWMTGPVAHVFEGVLDLSAL